MVTIKPLSESLSFSGLQRYIKIAEAIRNTDHRMSLSSADRWHMMNELLDSGKDYTIKEIEKYCDEYASGVSGYNMSRASWMRAGGF